jgi:hypothetical protein
MNTANNLEQLTNTMQQTNQFFLSEVKKQVNTALTLRNWIIDYYISEYEQRGKDRAVYGKQLFKAITESLLKRGVQSIRERQLYPCKDLYKAYPQILGTLSAKSYLINFQHYEILRTASAELISDKSEADMNQLLKNLQMPILMLNAVFLKFIRFKIIGV